MSLPLKEREKLNRIVRRVEAGAFDANDVENLIMKLRPYAQFGSVLLEVANFVAHHDARNKGLTHWSLLAFFDSFRFFHEYIAEKKPLYLARSFPAYIFRLMLSQAKLVDEGMLWAEHKIKRDTLVGKIESNFKVDKKSNVCSFRGKYKLELLQAIKFVLGFIVSRSAFHLLDFQRELKAMLIAHHVEFDEGAWNDQVERLSLVVLCLISSTEFVLPDGGKASCRIATENNLRLLSGQRRLPTGAMTTEPTTFGGLIILGEVVVNAPNGDVKRWSFPLVESGLDPHEFCDRRLFLSEHISDESGDREIEIINFADDMSLSLDYKLVQTASII